MIAVIADDFTGAAELAGISLRYGLRVELCLEKLQYEDADVLVICTDSRSLPLPDALEVTKEAVRQLKRFPVAWVYKKTDSVLRGYIVEELKLQQRLMRKEKVLLMPANPSLGRTIRNGEYFINGTRINETSFGHDPEFPVKSSFVKEVLQGGVEVLSPDASLPSSGIVAGEATTPGDYDRWAAIADNDWLLAGAGDFFTALLEKDHLRILQAPVEMSSPHLYVSGTAFDERREFIREMGHEKGLVAYLPKRLDEDWLEKADKIVKSKQRLIIAIDSSDESAADLRSRMAMAASAVIEKSRIKELFIEGGSTAAAVLQELGISKLQPVNELSRGVVRMRTGELFITVKPGSYQLPEQIKRLYKPEQ